MGEEGWGARSRVGDDGEEGVGCFPLPPASGMRFQTQPWHLWEDGGARPTSPPANRDMSRQEARLRRGVCLPSTPGAGNCWAGGAGEDAGAKRLPSGGLRASSPVRGGEERCLRPAWLFVPPGRAAFPPAPGFLPLNGFRGERPEPPAATMKFPFSSRPACVVKGWH